MLIRYKVTICRIKNYRIMKSIKYLRFANKLSLLVLFTLVFSCLACAQTVKRGDSILKDGIAIIPSEGGISHRLQGLQCE